MVRFRHRGRDLSSADIVYIRELIAAHPEASRRALSRLLCEAWEWRQPNGSLRDMVCRSMLLLLDRAAAACCDTPCRGGIRWVAAIPRLRIEDATALAGLLQDGRRSTRVYKRCRHCSGPGHDA